MTFVGKILVILIMALSLVFLGVSTVAFTTAENWKDATKKQADKVKEAEGKLATVEALKTKTEADFTLAKSDHAAATTKLETDIKVLNDANKKAQDEITLARTALVDAQANAKIALEEAAARAAQAEKLRDQYSSVQKTANDFKIQQTELNNEILNLKRMLEAAENNAKSLRETSAKFARLLKDKGFSTDISRVSPEPLPPNVEGKVIKVDGSNRSVEISLGSNDGLQVDQELYMFRTKPRPEYIGKVKITAVDPKQAVAIVVGTTVNGKKIMEGDDVASSITR